MHEDDLEYRLVKLESQVGLRGEFAGTTEFDGISDKIGDLECSISDLSSRIAALENDVQIAKERT
jgi:hypothetical protein